MKVDRRLIVMRTVGPNGVIKASEIAKKTGRSLQNISYAIRKLEKCGPAYDSSYRRHRFAI